MSLEQQIADLVAEASALNATFQSKKAEIETALAAAVAMAPSMIRTYYVDAVNGDDGNDGNQTAPFATIKKAVDSVPKYGGGLIFLKSGQTHMLTDHVSVGDKVIHLTSDYTDPTNPDIPTTNLTTVAYVRAISPSTNVNEMYAFLATGSGQIAFGRINVDLPNRADSAYNWNSYRMALVCAGTDGPNHTNVRFHRSKITVRDNNAVISTSSSSHAHVALVHSELISADGTGSLVNFGQGGTANIAGAGTITKSGGATWVNALNTNTDGVHNVITNLPGTLI